MLLPRQYYGGCYGYNCGSSNWDNWGRWILTGILIFLGILVLLVVVFLNRRRRRGGGGRLHPRIGMGGRSTKMQPPGPTGGYGGGVGGAGIYNQNQGYPQYEPAPGPPPYYGGGANADYYNGQTQGVAQPENVYQPPHIK